MLFVRPCIANKFSLSLIALLVACEGIIPPFRCSHQSQCIPQGLQAYPALCHGTLRMPALSPWQKIAIVDVQLVLVSSGMRSYPTVSDLLAAKGNDSLTQHCIKHAVGEVGMTAAYDK